MTYRRPYRGTQPDYLFPPYASTVKRAPSQPLVVLPHTLSELTAPVFGYGDIKPTDGDLTKQHKGEPQGERIVVSGRVLDENGKAILEEHCSAMTKDPRFKSAMNMTLKQVRPMSQGKITQDIYDLVAKELDQLPKAGCKNCGEALPAA